MRLARLASRRGVNAASRVLHERKKLMAETERGSMQSLHNLLSAQKALNEVEKSYQQAKHRLNEITLELRDLKHEGQVGNAKFKAMIEEPQARARVEHIRALLAQAKEKVKFSEKFAKEHLEIGKKLPEVIPTLQKNLQSEMAKRSTLKATLGRIASMGKRSPEALLRLVHKKAIIRPLKKIARRRIDAVQKRKANEQKSNK